MHKPQVPDVGKLMQWFPKVPYPKKTMNKTCQPAPQHGGEKQTHSGKSFLWYVLGYSTSDVSQDVR